MMFSMTGFGKADISSEHLSANIEIRSVNNRFCEISTRLPRLFSNYENEAKEIIRSRLGRGKISLVITVEQSDAVNGDVHIDESTAKKYYSALAKLKSATGIDEKVSIEHLLHFSKIFEAPDEEQDIEALWKETAKALVEAVDNLNAMRRAEGTELARDLRERLMLIDHHCTTINSQSAGRSLREMEKLRERVAQLVEDIEVIDRGRLELELAILADKLDITEEIVRLRSHLKFFIEAMDAPEPAGRKLNFLIQEMNREVNTIGSKTSDAEIAHIVVNMKEEMERIREQLQNIE